MKGLTKSQQDIANFNDKNLPFGLKPMHEMPPKKKKKPVKKNRGTVFIRPSQEKIDRYLADIIWMESPDKLVSERIQKFMDLSMENYYKVVSKFNKNPDKISLLDYLAITKVSAMIKKSTGTKGKHDKKDDDRK